jgi:hypothetical protein
VTSTGSPGRSQESLPFRGEITLVSLERKTLKNREDSFKGSNAMDPCACKVASKRQNDFTAAGNHSLARQASPLPQVSVVGIDIAKQIFHGVGMDDTGTVVWRKCMLRGALMSFIARMPPAVIGMEACGGVQDWAWRFREHGHSVKLTAPQFVKPSIELN